MSGKYKQVTAVLRAFLRSDFTALSVEFDDISISMSKESPVIEPIAREVPAASSPPAALRSAERAAKNQAGEIQVDAATDPMLHAVRAPKLGTLYRAPSPGERPFVDNGARVGMGDTLCIIECMKLSTTISADVAGQLVRFDVENGSLVEFDQPIAYIRPE